MANKDTTDTHSHSSVRMIGTLPPWKGISAYCEVLYDGLSDRWDQFTFTGWRSLYPKRLYPGGDPKTGEEIVDGPDIERELAWYNPVSWFRVGLDPEVDLVHAQWWSYPLAVPYIAIFTAGKLRGKQILVTVHNVEPHEQTVLTSFLNDAVYRFADEYVVHSETNRTQLSEAADISPDAIHVISHPTIGPERDHLSRAEALERLGLSPGTDAVLFFGNIRDYKGLDDLIRMVARINEDQDIDLIVAGKCWEEWDEYAALLDRHGLSEQTHRSEGYIPEDQLEPLFTAADVVALPYKYFDAQSGVAELADHFDTVSVGYDEGGLAEQVDVVATDETSFERSLVAAIDGEVDANERSNDAVEKHVELYRKLLD